MTHFEKALIPLAGVVLMAAAVFLATEVQAQTTYVVCRSLMDSSVTSVFPNSCPSGWVFVKYA